MKQSWMFNTRELLLSKEFGRKPFRLLDVGMGNDSPLKIKQVFPACEYHGIDRNVHYNLSAESLRLATKYYELDLTRCRFEEIPDAAFDALLFSHVIEHLPNAEEVVKRLLAKLRVGGVVYVEWPSFRSLWLPSMRGTLNFFDDPTHVRLFSRAEVCAMLQAGGCVVEQFGMRRNPFRVALSPVVLLKNRLNRGYFEASDFWEILGFADYAFARKIGQEGGRAPRQT